jgi:CheY-like chemotaxis protein
MKRILVLEDEFFLLNSMMKYLGGLPDVKVYGYSTLKSAIEGLRLHPPDLIFSDIRLPDGLGLQLIDSLMELEMAVPLVFISAYVDDHREHIPKHSNISILEKPLSLKRLRDLAEQKLSDSSMNATSEFFFRLSDYLQIAGMGQHSVRICCGEHAWIDIFEGQPWHAQDEDGDGDEAFKRIIALWETTSQGSNITCKRISEGDCGDKTLHGSLDGLLLDAVREVDETNREARQIKKEIDEMDDFEDLDSAPAFEIFCERGVELMLDKKYLQAQEAFAQAHQIDPNHSLVRANLERLDQLIQQHQNRKEPA